MYAGFACEILWDGLQLTPGVVSRAEIESIFRQLLIEEAEAQIKSAQNAAAAASAAKPAANTAAPVGSNASQTPAAANSNAAESKT